MDAAQAAKTARKQWSSCDFCRERKKVGGHVFLVPWGNTLTRRQKCDARERRELGLVRCSRCDEADTDCTFDYAAKKNVIRQARRRQSMAARIDADLRRDLHAMPGVPTQVAFDPAMCSYASGVMLDLADQEVLAGGAVVDLDGLDNLDGLTGTTDPGFFSSAALRTNGHGLSDKDIDDILFPVAKVEGLVGDGSFVGSGSMPGDTISSQISSPEGAAFASTIGSFTTPSPGAAGGSTSLVSTKTSSGLDAELELLLLQEFMDLAYVQLPICDIDVTFLRHRYSLPSPMPRYLLMAFLACGALYSARRRNGARIDGRRAQAIYEEAWRDVLGQATSDMSVDAVVALMVMSFHYIGDARWQERMLMHTLGVHKIQAMGLHTDRGVRAGRTQREIGVLKYIVWLNYVVDSFGIALASVEDAVPQSLPYNGVELELDEITTQDSDAMNTEFLSGRPRCDYSPERSYRGIFFMNAFNQLARIQNRAATLQLAGAPLRELEGDIRAWEARHFAALDLHGRPWSTSAEGFRGFEGLTAGMTSLNFSFWFCFLGIHYDALKANLDANLSSGTLPLSLDRRTPASGPLDEGAVRACRRAYTTMIGVFEVLYRAHYLYSLSQVTRNQLYAGGRVLQTFYRNGVLLDGEPVVDVPTLVRWEKCLEVAEHVWGFSSRGIDLRFMSLHEP